MTTTTTTATFDGPRPSLLSLIGAFFADDPQRRAAYIAASTRITHTDPKALTGATAGTIVRAFLHHNLD